MRKLMQPSPEAHIPHLNPELKMGANVGGVDILRGGWRGGEVGRGGGKQLKKKKSPTPTVMSLCNVILHFLMVMSFLICDGSRIVFEGWMGLWVGGL